MKCTRYSFLLNKLYHFSLLFTALTCLSGVSLAEEAVIQDLKMSPAISGDGMLHLNNQICPLMNKENKKQKKFAYDGVEYTLCCSICMKDFKKNPEAYAFSPDQIAAVKAAAEKADG